jgi:hypothetical protein
VMERSKEGYRRQYSNTPVKEDSCLATTDDD